jgi:hypothetical protein
MHAILVTMGADGDVFPYVGLGARLRGRGLAKGRKSGRGSFPRFLRLEMMRVALRARVPFCALLRPGDVGGPNMRCRA